jgi:two-component system, OmpR family, sensor kinase
MTMSGLSLRARLTVWYTVVLVIVLFAGGAGVWWMQGRIGVGRVDSELADVNATVVRIISNELQEGEPVRAAATEASETVADRNLAVAIFDPAGALLASRSTGFDLGAFSGGSLDGASTKNTSSGAWRVRSRTERIGATSVLIVLARGLSDVDRQNRELLEAMAVGIPLVLMLAAAAGWWLASIGLAPITAMARRAVQLPLTGSEDLGDPARGDELGQLTVAFNGLVARLRTALRTQRQFMADASHELRTPVSIIRSASDVTLSREHRDEGEYRETLAIVGDQASRLGQLVADMLVLARADSGGYPIRATDLDLSEVVDDCRRAVRILAAERGVQIQSATMTETPVHGDEDLLRRLVLNLLNNAIEYSPTGGSVSIGVHPEPSAVRIRVADSGPGIPEGDRARIFDRFVRLDEARSGKGTGLGLPIARWIAEVHGGTLVLETSGPGGSTFCATLATLSTLSTLSRS